MKAPNIGIAKLGHSTKTISQTRDLAFFFISETEVTLRVVRRVCPEIGMISIPQLWLFKNGENEVLNFASSL
jgi:hypothetical protein